MEPSADTDGEPTGLMSRSGAIAQRDVTAEYGRLKQPLGSA